MGHLVKEIDILIGLEHANVIFLKGGGTQCLILHKKGIIGKGGAWFLRRLASWLAEGGVRFGRGGIWHIISWCTSAVSTQPIACFARCACRVL